MSKKKPSKKTGAARRTKAAPAKAKSARKPASKAKKTETAPQGGLWRWVKRGLALAIWLAVFATAGLVYFAWDLPDPEKVIAETTRRPTVAVVAEDGSTLSRRGRVYGRPIKLEDVPPHLPHAYLATEDRRFYWHPGVDPIGLLRALWTNIKAGGIRQGGSTITQQLAKNLFLTHDRTIKRKVQEVLLAFWLERKLTKDQILTVYLNRIYLGAGTYGVDAAARRYFGRPADELTLYQAAVLGGLPKAPSRYNPIAAPAKAAARANEVLDNMVEADFLSQREADAAKRDTVATVKDRVGGNSRYYADWAMARVEDIVGRPALDMVVKTTFNPTHQRVLEQKAQALFKTLDRRRVGQMAAVIMRPDGAVTAMLGGRSWRQTQYNRVVQARRQPGSAFKLFVFMAALEAGMEPGTKVNDRAITIEGWSPRNAGGQYHGEVTLREAAARSLNSTAVAVMEQVGRRPVIQAARRLGISTPMDADPALALGVHEVTLLELTGAYAVFANGGTAAMPYAIRLVRDLNGKAIYRSQPQSTEVVNPGVAADMNDLLRAVTVWGTGKRAKLDGRWMAGKTGTSQKSRDAWFVGYTDDLVMGVWMGNDNAAPTKGVSGGSLPAQLWKSVMEALPPGA